MKLRNLLIEANSARPRSGMIVKFKGKDGHYVLTNYRKSVDRDGHWDGDGEFRFENINDPSDAMLLRWWPIFSGDDPEIESVINDTAKTI